MDSWSVAAVVAIGAAFVLIRRIPGFLVAGATIVCTFAIGTHRQVGDTRFTDWLVINAGLLAWVAGLAAIRAMLIRSVSLQLMAHLDSPDAAHFEEQVRARLDDIRLFHLARRHGDTNALTPLGALVARVVAVLYGALEITP